MARNQEKAQSMLYRFREAQAASLGLSSSSSTLRRPRLASSVTSLKEAERWRSDVIREISRKVSKIQDFGLTDYEVRDLNDEINKLLREKGHWENQILQLGGANYKRAVPSMTDQGMGRGGYKYFGRAKDLPGVKEAFVTSQREKEERYERFNNLPPGYYGDEDEDDGVLLAEEASAEEGEWSRRFRDVAISLHADLDEGSDADIQVPLIPRPPPKSWMETMQAFHHSLQSADVQTEPPLDETAGKRPAPQDDPSHASSKRQKADQGQPVSPTPAGVGYSIFTAQDLQAPPVPDRTAMEKVILRERKRALRNEYIGA